MTIQQEQNLFMASISHELRTPLTSILGYGELLENTNLDNKQQEYLNRMMNSSKYLLALVGDFLDIVKLKNNDISLEKKEVRLHTILTECSDVVKATLNKNVNFEVDIPFLNHTILLDDRRLKQVILNILSNASKFTQTGTIKFYVKDIIYGDEHTRVTVNIEDTGAGMSKEIQKALFNPFVTGDSTQGFGLGLFISQEIIKMMDGEICVSSKEGVGSIFSVSFLVEKAKDKESSEVLLGKNILMLSDNIEYTKNLSNQLKRFDASLQYYSSSQDITKTLRNILSNATEYSIAIFDMTSITCSIPDIIATLRMLHPSLKCVALLDKYNSIDIPSFDKVIHLPIDAKELIFEIEELSAIKQNDGKSIIDFSHLKVLVVEDVEMSRDYIEEMFLVSFSLICDTAVNGKEAVEKVKNNSYDLIFMDIRMPIMNGYEATREIRKLNKEIPIICMSADVYEKDKEAAKNSGMNHFIEKPLDKDDVKQSFLDFTGTEIKDSELNVHANIKNRSNELVQKDVEFNQRPIESNSLDLKKKAYVHLAKNFDDTVVEKLLKTATQSIELYVNNINHNAIEKDMNKLSDDFHAIKGVLANLGLQEEAKMAGEIQDIFQLGVYEKARLIKQDFLKSMTIFLNELQSGEK